ncbi:MAG: putative Ig domain-containing protein [Oligoflexia bacterium]
MKGSPGSISYVTNPARYYVNQPITANILQTSGPSSSVEITPALPAGLSFDSVTGTITGTPTAIAAAQAHQVRVINALGTSYSTLHLQVGNPAPTPSVSTSSWSATVGTPVSIPVTLSGGVLSSCSVSPALPAGLTQNTTTCGISGTPTAVYSARTVRIFAASDLESKSVAITLGVSDTLPQISYNSQPFAFARGNSVTPIAANSTGGAPTSCSSSPSLPAGLTLGNTCTLSGRPTALSASSTYTVTATNSGGSSSTSVVISVQDSAPVFRYNADQGRITLTRGSAISTLVPAVENGMIDSCSVTPALPTGLILAPDCTLSGTPTTVQTETTHTFTAANSAGTGSTPLKIRVNDIAPNFSYPTTLITLTNRQAFSTVPAAHTGGTSTSCTPNPSLPAGLSVNANCDLSGTPSVAAAATTYTFTASNSGGTSSRTLFIRINEVSPQISYSPSALTATLGQTITNVTVTNAGGAITSCVPQPALPPGLSLSSNCTISGTPSALRSQASYTLTASNGVGSSSSAYSITVVDVVPAIQYLGSPQTLTVGQALSTWIPVNTGGVVTQCAVSPALPSGLSLNSVDCSISGTPTQVSSSTQYTVTATNTGGQNQTTLQLTVQDVPPQIAFSPLSRTFTQGVAISSFGPNRTGGSITQCSVSPALPAGLLLATVSGNCEISGTPTAVTPPGSYLFTATNTGGTATASLSIEIVDPPPQISYSTSPFTWTRAGTLTPTSPTNSGGPILSCTVNPALPGGLVLSSNCTLSGAPSAIQTALPYTITASNSGGSASTSITITVNDTLPVISYSPNTLVSTKDTTIATQSLSNSGGAIVSCSVSPSLPTGLSLTSSTCAISGTPTVVSAQTTYTVTATNSGGSASTQFTLTVNDQTPDIYYSPNLITATRGTAITSVYPVNAGGIITGCTISPALPAGMSFNSNFCSISGTPSVTSLTTAYTVTATNSGGTSEANLLITVNDTPPVITYSPTTLTATSGTAITASTPSSTGGSFTSCTSNPTLPAGLSISNACTISGTPTAITASAVYTITATGSGGSGSTLYTIVVNDTLPNLTYTGSPFTWGRNVTSVNLIPTNSGGTVTSCSITPLLPTGLSISSTCAITGIATVLSPATTYTVSATNSGGTITRTISIQINETLPVISYTASPYSFTRGNAITTVNAIQSGAAPTSCSSSPTLPTGLSLSAVCAISGTPTTNTAAANYTITATNANGTAQATINIAIIDRPPAITYSPATLTATRATAITAATPTSSGGAFTICSASPSLPAGLSISAACTISGTPTAITASAVYTVTATGPGGSGSALITITVNDTLPNLTYTGSPFTYGRSVTSVNLVPTSSGGTVTSCSITPTLPTGLSISSTCAITGIATVLSPATNYTVSATNSGGTITRTINIRVNEVLPVISYPASPYSFTRGNAIASVAAVQTGGAPTSCSSSPTLPTGLSLSAVCTISGTPTANTAATNYTITATNGSGTAQTNITITIVDRPPAITYSPATLTATRATAITATTPTSSGGAFTICSASPSLPAGLSISAACTISGTPSAVTASAVYTVTATGPGGSGSALITITVNDTSPNLTYTGSPFTYGRNVTSVSLTPTNTGGTVTSCSITPPLPTGLSISSTCAITGIATVLSPATTYTVSATNSGGTITRTISIQINETLPVISYAASPYSFTRGNAITPVTAVQTGGAPTSCSSSPSLPSGLSLSNICTISGTPTVMSAATSYTITATNANGSSQATITLGITDQAPSLTFNGAPYSFTVNETISTQTPTNSGGNVTSCSSSPSLPAGLSLSSSCEISGTPTAVTALANYTISATNTGGTQQQSLSIEIVSTVPNLPNTFASWISWSNIDGTFNTSANSEARIWKAKADGSSRTLHHSLTLGWSTLDLAQPPRLAPNGSYWIAVSYRNLDGNPASTPLDCTNLWKVSPDGSVWESLTRNDQAGLDSVDPVISPDSNQIAFAQRAPSAPFNLFQYVISTSSLEQLTNEADPAAHSVEPAYHPNGTHLIFASRRPLSGTTPNLSYNLWTYTFSGATLSALTNTALSGRDRRQPTYNSDGTLIAHSARLPVSGVPSSSSNIFIMNSNGTGESALTIQTSAGRDSEYPQFSNEDRFVSYQSLAPISGVASAAKNFWILDRTTSTATAITRNTGAGLDSLVLPHSAW